MVCGEQAAGPDLALSVGRGEAIRIYTGAPIPQHADAVIMQEDVDADERTILVREGSDQWVKTSGCVAAIFARVRRSRPKEAS